MDQRLSPGQLRKVIFQAVEELIEERAQLQLPSGTGLPGDREAAAATQLSAEYALRDGRATWRQLLQCGLSLVAAESDPEEITDGLVGVIATALNWITDLDQQAAAAAVRDKVPCAEGFHWIGQSFVTCDKCGLPAWEHAGTAERELTGPLDATTPWTLRPWGPGQAEAIRAKWERR